VAWNVAVAGINPTCTRSPRAGRRSSSAATSRRSRECSAIVTRRWTPHRLPSGRGPRVFRDLLCARARRPPGQRAPEIVYAAGRGGVEVLDANPRHVRLVSCGGRPGVRAPDRPAGPLRRRRLRPRRRHGAEHADGRSDVRAPKPRHPS
jgi:hypothetical protein